MKKARGLLLILVFFPLFPGVAEQEITIVASFYPVYIMAQNVLSGVENVNLVSMTAPSTGCLHDYQLLTSDMRALSRASAFLINGAGMEGFLPAVQSQLPSLPIVDCSAGIELICEGSHDHEHGHDHDHEENPHIWLDPRNAIRMVKNLEAGFLELLPEAAEQISANAENYIARLERLDRELAEAISVLPRKEIVTFHEAFPYFARAYDLHIVAVIALEPDDPLSPRMLSETVKTVRAAGNPPLFAEPQYKSAALAAISRETQAPVFVLDPLVTGDGALTAYEDAMRKNLAVLVEALM